VLKLEKLKEAFCVSESCGDIKEKRQEPKKRKSTEDLRKGIPLVWRETLEDGIPGGKRYSL